MKYAKRINDSWRVAEVYGEGAAAEAQAAVYLAQGYKPVLESERPADTEFIIWSDSYADDGDEVVQSWWSSPLVIKLDRAKLLSAASQGGWLDEAVGYFSDDPDAQHWWATNMTYVEGSPMAQMAMEALDLTLEQVHALVLQCRE